MQSRSLVPLFALAAFPLAVSAQVAKDTARIAPVVVTATRSPLAAGRTPASTSVVTGEQLRREGITTVIDALRQVPGVSVVQTGSYGGQTSLFIRGGESKFAKVLIDGIPVNDAGGAFDFSTLSTDNLDRIEIVRGPASVLYGSDAMAGVIQLFTRLGTGRTHAELSGRGGKYGSYDADGAVRGSTDMLTYSLAGARHRTDGIQSFNSQYRQDVASALVGARGNGADASVSLRYSDANLHFPTNGSGQVVDSNAMRRDDRLAAGIDAGYRFSPLVELRLSLAAFEMHGLSEDQADSPGDTKGYYFSTGDRSHRRSGDLRLNVDVTSALRYTIGGQVEGEWQASETQSNFGPNAFTARRRTRGVYSQLLFAPAEPYTIALGGRYERNEQFGDFFTYRAAGSAQLASTRFRASVGTAFREPTFLENFGGAFAIGNAALTPEHALSVDAGVEQGIGSWGMVGVTYFANSFRDLIDYKYSATAPNYNNIARTRSSGAELEGRVTLMEGLSVDAAMTYLSTRVVDPGTSAAVTATFAPGARLLRRPMHTIDLGLGYHVAIGGVDLRAHRVGTREDNYFPPDFAPTQHVTLAPYTRADLSGELRILAESRGTVTLTLRAENLFDARYTDVAGFNFDFARRDAVSLAQTGYRGAGRRVLSGVRVAF
ncbi:MAG: TonB-dependent receptor [Gemmatimonadetes bacterium]|nr:TonB-dependent receptor [Gemmatimonadota bacterium]